MSLGLFRGAVAMVGYERRLDAIATNLANLETPGFKRNASATHEFVVQRRTGPVRGQELRTEVDFSQGNLRRTENPWDLAIYGDGFFTVEGPNGPLYTRAGTFQPTEDGVLVTSEGYEVAWRRRSGVFDPTGLPVKIDGDGVVRQGNFELGQLEINDFTDRSRLVPIDGGYWVAPSDLGKATTTGTVQQYALEESNAASVEEVVAMIGVQRSFEAVSNLVRSIEESYSRLTRSTF
jgi:flagellar basal-body rod protein FlgG